MKQHLFPVWAGLFSLLVTSELQAESLLLNLDESRYLTPQQQLGQQLFFDKNLSNPVGQACASCHMSDLAFTDPELGLPVSKGAVTSRFGLRNTPSAMYSAYSPVFHFDSEEGIYFGGQFLDGRADDLVEQAKAPFLNPDEMNNSNAAMVIEKIRQAEYADLFKAVYGSNALDNVDEAYQKTAEALAAFENTPVFNRFNSKYDYYLAGLTELTESEAHGLVLFEAEDKGNCAACHPSTSSNSTPPLFTDFSYDNLGLPVNPVLQALKTADFIDLGLGAVLNDVGENGKFKVPSLRNVAKTAPYMHNGIFKTLREVVEFYNTRDVDSSWGSPEVPETVNHDELGDLKLTGQEVEDLVAFMRTLNDGFSVTSETVFYFEQGALVIPLLRLQGNGLDNKLFQAQMLQTDSNIFELTKLNEITSDNVSLSGDLPRYSFADGLLRLPVVTSAASSYIVQLQKIPSDNGPIRFQSVLIKPLQ